jgi:arylsulfatase A-like enzyme
MDKGPFFIWIHLVPPHEPYLPPAPHKDLYCKTGRFTTIEEQAQYANYYRPEAQKDIDELRLRYNEFIHYCDDELERFLESLQGASLLDNTLLIISADHGQSFADGYYGHNGWPLWNQLIKIPLIMHMPGLPGARLSVNAEQIDLGPTILDALGFRQPQWMQGESLMPYLLGQKKQTDKPKYAMQLEGNSRFANSYTRGGVVAMLGSLKLLYNVAGDGAYLYDLASDPEEEHDIAQSRPEDVKKLKAFIQRDILTPAGM